MKRHYAITKMLLALCLTVTIAGVFAEFAEIIESKSSTDGQGNYEFHVRTSDGITKWQTGRLQYSGDKPYIYVEGGYSYLDRSEGVKRVVTFVADQNGYRPVVSQEPLGTQVGQGYQLPPNRLGSRFVTGSIGG